MLETTNNKIVYEITDITQTVYAFGIRFFEQTDIKCYLLRDGTETELVYGTDYTVPVQENYDTGANVTILKTLVKGDRLSIVRSIDVVQETHFPLNGKISSVAIEGLGDRLVACMQQIVEIAKRSLTIPHGMASGSEEEKEFFQKFEELVNNAEIWATTASTAAAAASASATNASASAGSALTYSNNANNYRQDAHVYATESFLYAGTASTAAATATTKRDEIYTLVEGARGDRVSLFFDDWNASTSMVSDGYISFDDWTGTDDFISISIHNDNTGAHSNGFSHDLTVQTAEAPSLLLKQTGDHGFVASSVKFSIVNSSTGVYQGISILSVRHGSYEAQFRMRMNSDDHKSYITPCTYSISGGVYTEDTTRKPVFYDCLANTQAAGDSSAKLATTAFATNAASAVAVPAGTVIAYAGPITGGTHSVPTGYVECDGQAYSRTGTYAALFGAIGTTYGEGDRTTTFNVPNFQGMFLRGYLHDTSEELGTKQAEGLPNITGAFAGGAGGTYSGAFTRESDKLGTWDSYGDWGIVQAHFDASLCGGTSSLYGKSDHVTPVNYAIYWLIKY